MTRARCLSSTGIMSASPAENSSTACSLFFVHYINDGRFSFLIHRKGFSWERYRTTPLKGLWTHTKGGFYNDGRFATLEDVLKHYDGHFKLELAEQESNDLSEYLQSL
jgi:hypothetical protein